MDCSAATISSPAKHDSTLHFSSGWWFVVSQSSFLSSVDLIRQLGRLGRTIALGTGLGTGLLALMLQAGAALGAERITVSYGALERSINISSLEQYAIDGTISRDLRTYTSYLNEAQRQQFRQALQARANLSVVAVSQFLYTQQGEILLRQLGEVVRTESNLSGFLAIRSALILAAAAPEGLTALSVLQAFPLSDIRIDLGRTLEILGDLQTLIRQTQEATLLIDQQSGLEAAIEIGSSRLPNLEQFGAFSWQMNTIELDDLSRARKFPVDLYLPQPSQNQAMARVPVVVISHGLGSDRSTYAYLARQLASYGFAVAVPEHPGSNAQQLQALIAGTASEVTSPSEFVDRPLDIKYLLDQLAQLNQSDPTIAGRLNLDQVGVVGQSFGGYTALALAGAQINFQQLAVDCEQEGTFNLSLLLQCRALELRRSLPDLQDARVKSIIAINPIGSSLLGAEDFAKIQVPVMVVSGSSDTIAPALLEQIRPFTWLESANKYLVLLQGGTHFSTIDVPPTNTEEAIQLPSEIVGPDPALAQTYLKILSTAFFQTYLAQNPNYQSYLAANYTRSISESLLPIALVQSLSLPQLASSP
jgi:predicted dienelactone hydrolase